MTCFLYPVKPISKGVSHHSVCVGTLTLWGHYLFCTVSMGTKCPHKVHTVTHTRTCTFMSLDIVWSFRFSSGNVSVCTHRISIVRGTKVVVHNNRNPAHAYTYTSTWKSKTPKCVHVQRFLKRRKKNVNIFSVIYSKVNIVSFKTINSICNFYYLYTIYYKVVWNSW